jgi:hypothetical protein
VDGKKVVFPDGQPFIDESSRTLSPARFIGEALGAEVTWDDETQTAKFHKIWQLPPGQYESIVRLTVGKADYTVHVKGPGGLDATETRTMDTTAVNKGDRIYVPARYLAESLSATVEYEPTTRTITIVSVEPEYTAPTAEPSGTTKPADTTKPAETQKPTETQKPAEPTTTPTQPATETPKPEDSPKQTGRAYDMNDPNVKAFLIYATAKSAAELKAALGWQSAAEIIANQKDPDNTIDGVLFYDLRMKPIQEWVDTYVAANGLSYKGKTDYQKTAIIKHIVESGRFEEFIGLWEPGFKFTSGDCAPRANAVRFLMIAMDFKLFGTVSCTVNVAHATNAYWDSEANAVRFVDSDLGFGVWNLYVDELDEMGFTLTN